jgi:uncharacterized delta-60 repeat protein
MRANFFNSKIRKETIRGIGFILLFFPFISLAQITQEWTQTYSGPAKGMDEAHAITADGNGNTFITGASINTNGDLDIITIMYDASGKMLWKQVYDGTGHDDDNGKAILSWGNNIYVAGYSTGKGTGEDMILIKYSNKGEQLWVKTYNGTADSSDQALALAPDTEGKIYVTGYSTNKGTGTDMTTLCYHPDGELAWVKTYNGSANENDAARAIIVKESGDCYITGYSVNNDTYYDITTIHYDEKGNQVWVKTFNGKADDYDEANAMATDGQGNIYVTGFTDVSDKRNDIILIKYNSAGDVQWTKTYNGKGNDDEARAISVSSNGNIYITGHTTNKNGDYDLIILCFNTSGVQQWVQTYNGTLNSDDEGVALESDGNGDVYVTGYSNNTEASEDIITIKYNSAGVQQWMKIFNGTENFDDYPYGIALDKGNVFVTGATNYDILNNTNDGDIILIKYNQTTK